MLRRRANARNVSFRISLRWPTHIINPVNKTKLSCYTSHRSSTTVSLETYPSINLELNEFNHENIKAPTETEYDYIQIKKELAY